MVKTFHFNFSIFIYKFLIQLHTFIELKSDFDENLFGQHIAQQIIIAALTSHYNNLEKSKKPLVIVLNGSPGTGKNFVADRIAKHLYKNGEKSKYVHKFYGRTTYPLESDVPLYRVSNKKFNSKNGKEVLINFFFCQTMLKAHIEKAVTSCERSLFIFDEVEKMPAGIFNEITTFLDHHDNINGLKYSHSLFIFLTNAAGRWTFFFFLFKYDINPSFSFMVLGVEIANALSKLVENGKLREDTKLYDFEQTVEYGAYNVAGKHKTFHNQIINLNILFCIL